MLAVAPDLKRVSTGGTHVSPVCFDVVFYRSVGLAEGAVWCLVA